MKDPQLERQEQSDALRKLAIQKSQEADKLIELADQMLTNNPPNQEASEVLRNATALEREKLREIKDPAARLARWREMRDK